MGSLCVTQRAQTGAMLGWDGVGSGREVQEGGDTYMLMIESLCYVRNQRKVEKQLCAN